jgi:hypothetical protein
MLNDVSLEQSGIELEDLGLGNWALKALGDMPEMVRVVGADDVVVHDSGFDYVCEEASEAMMTVTEY